MYRGIINLVLLITLIAMLSLMTGCGKGNEEVNLRVITHTIKCDNNGTCSNDSMVCFRQGYYSNEWECNIIIEEE